MLVLGPKLRRLRLLTRRRRGLGGDARWALEASGSPGTGGLRLFGRVRNQSTCRRRPAAARAARAQVRGTWRDRPAFDTNRCGRRWRPRAACASTPRGAGRHSFAAFGRRVVEDLLALGASMAPLTRSGSRRRAAQRARRGPSSLPAAAGAAIHYLTAPTRRAHRRPARNRERADGRAMQALLAALGVDAAAAFDRRAAAARTRGRERRAPRPPRGRRHPRPTAAAGRRRRRRRGRRRAVRFAVVDEIDRRLLAEHFMGGGKPDGRDAQQRIYEQWRAAFIGRHGGAEFDSRSTRTPRRRRTCTRASPPTARRSPVPPPHAAGAAARVRAPTPTTPPRAPRPTRRWRRRMASLDFSNRTWRRTEAGGVELKEHAAPPPASSDRLLADFVRPPFVEKSRGRLSTRTINSIWAAPASSQPHWHNRAELLGHGRKVVVSGCRRAATRRHVAPPRARARRDRGCR